MAEVSLVGRIDTKDYQHFTIYPNDRTASTPQFEGAANAGRALPGDIVEWNGTSCTVLKRGSDCTTRKLFLVGTLELAAKVRYGMTTRGAPIFRFTPYSAEYPPFFVGCSQKDTSKNILAKIQFDSWPEHSTCPRGLLVQVFGVAGDLAAEEEALLAEYGMARWKKGELKDLVDPVLPPRHPSLKDQCGYLGTFHIDPPGCRDIDDAISLFLKDGENAGESYQLQIHIADVASWLLANPSLAQKAEEIGQTLYKDGTAVRPMFPLELSEGKFSLLPGEQRGALTLAIDWKRGAGIQSPPRWMYTTICVDGSWTYETAKEAPWAETLAEITSTLGGRNLTDPHEWVEHLMLFYNQEAAKVLRSNGLGILRRHSAPEKERLALSKAAGIPPELIAYSSGEYCSALEEDVEHWGIGASVYCHASSPIRRWADCLNQLALFRCLFKEDGTQFPQITADSIENLKRLSKAAKSYERDLTYVRLLLSCTAGTTLPAIVLQKGEVWVEPWRRRLRADTGDLETGSHISLSIFHDASKRNWKQRLVIKVKNIA